MGEVLRHDLSSGRLLDLENDLPELLKATELAASSIRQLIKELRSTSMGRGGLTSTVALLVEQVASETRIKIDSVLEDVGGSPQTQLLIYQVAREGIGNAVKHASAARLFIALTIVERRIRLIVEDDGKGFVAGEVDGDKHFGLQLMRERVDMAGGTFSLESTPGGGTKIVAEFPADVAF
jgi:signal transduction histidine kinase